MVKTKINVMNNKINIIRIGNEEYISLTDLVRYANAKNLKYQFILG